MKSIVLIIPYFGHLPPFFPVWKMSALNNPTIDFLFFTDIDCLQSEHNIHVVHISFADFRDLLQKSFDFPIALKQPYKLCDFKPAYGFALGGYIQEYDFWGHCDIDLIFGDIRKFITDEILDAHQKILEHGHFTLYHNDTETNTAFMRCTGYGDYDFRKAFSTDESVYFDEFLGTQIIFRKLGIPTYYDLTIFFQVDTQPKRFQYRYMHYNNVVFQYENGKLYTLQMLDDDIQRKEIMYAHFLKRKIDCTGFQENSEYLVIPNKLVFGSQSISPRLFQVHGDQIYVLQKKWDHLREYVNRYRSGNYRSFAEYRKVRLNFRNDLRGAKRLIEEYGNSK